MDMRGRLKAKELRKKSEDELLKTLSEIDRELSKWRAAQQSPGGSGGGVNVPVGRHGGPRWGIFQNLKKNKAVILTILTENKKRPPGQKP